MKRGTPRHPKTYALAAALAIPLPYAVGILEMLWHFAAANTPEGDIGRLPNMAIVEACGWVVSDQNVTRRLQKSDRFVTALLQSGWLDENEEYRLILHDWPEHCDQSVLKLLEYRKKDFLPVYGVSIADRKKISRESLPSRVGVGKGLGEVSSKSKTKPKVSHTGWEEFWSSYWRKAGFGGAKKAYEKHVTSPEIHAAVMAAISSQRHEMLQRAMEKRPYAATWLNQTRWLDDPAGYGALTPTDASRRAEKAKAEVEDFERKYSEWEAEHPGGSREEFADWSVEQYEREMRGEA